MMMQETIALPAPTRQVRRDRQAILRDVRRRVELVCKVLDLPASEVDRVIKGDAEAILDFADHTGQSIDWLVLGDEAMIRAKYNAKLNAELLPHP